ncbi:hypothetical protein BAE44_0010121 [Dichanthelium oligosanthes]|uniref:Uncharacterized protein n=1 Tax=Dichanthelium oligosanthes TaxID=888268 RepID=A0A1E5VUT3_9POAL|nr:hypothetical protein BAE44_0010121 [Dichanthelium oligosanthes]
MHRVETSYKARMEERLRRYEAHMLAKAKEAQLLPNSCHPFSCACWPP